MLHRAPETSATRSGVPEDSGTHNWDFTQCFGDRSDLDSITEGDVISSVEFDKTGEFLATGDRGGRIVLFKREEQSKSDSDENENENEIENEIENENENENDHENGNANGNLSKNRNRNINKNKNINGNGNINYNGNGIGNFNGNKNFKNGSDSGFLKQAPEYRFYTEFQSHDREFDYLKSLEIEEKINQIRWCRPTNNAHYLLSTNDKTIKLWKSFEKSIKIVSDNNGTDRLGPRSFGAVPISELRLPRMTLHDTIVATAPKRTFANAHAYHINSISVNSDGETFLSSDDLRVNLWHLNEQDKSFNIVDIRPSSMEELTEVITAVECHPFQCNEFVYSTCKGNVRLADMRERALCDTFAKNFTDPTETGGESFFTEITSSISDVKYTPNGKYLVARDFMAVKIWDVAMEREPVEVIPVHDNIKQWLCTSYETDSIFDKFGLEISGDSRSVMTGSYSSNFFIYPHVIGRSHANANFNSNSNSNSNANSNSNSNANANVNTNANSNSNSIPTDTELMDIDSEDDDDFIELDDGPMRRSHRSQADVDVVALTADKNVFRKRQTDEKAKLNRRNKKVDFRKNILHMSWHPFENTVAIAATNNLFMFNALP